MEIPYKFRDREPIHPGLRSRGFYRNAEGLAEDVRFFAGQVYSSAEAQLEKVFPKVRLPKAYGGNQVKPVGWIWSRTVPSPDPAFSSTHVPITSSFLLSLKKGKEFRIVPVVSKSGKRIEYTIEAGGTSEQLKQARSGTKTARGANFKCLLSGAAITPDYVRAQAKAGQINQTLLAIVVSTPGGRVYLPPSKDQEKAALSAIPSWKPQDSMNEDSKDLVSGRGYNYRYWYQLFTNRQLAVLSAISDEIKTLSALLKEQTKAHKNEKPDVISYADAVVVYLTLALSRMADNCNAHCLWASDKTQLKHMFGRQAIPMTWDFFEANPFAGGAGDFLVSAGTVAKVLDRWSGSSWSMIKTADARSVDYPQKTVNSTDPPYYDNIAYADLSDFFYLWLKRGLKEIYPDVFGLFSTPKAEELVALSYRHGAKSEAQQFFLDGMTEAVRNMANSSSNSYPTTIYYAFKQSEIDKEGISSTGWATFLRAVIEAGYAVVGTWPLRTEWANRLNASGANALANSVVLVCRKKDACAETITRAEFIRALKRELPIAIAELQAANIAPADMPQSAIGPGMGIFSRYRAVLEADDSSMAVKTALQLINRELDDFLNDIQGEFDPDTRFAITWFEQHGNDKGEYGSANTIAQARGISVEGVKHAGIVESAAGSVRILKRDELLDDWSPENEKHLTIWECCQYLIRTLETRGEHEAAVLLKQIGSGKAEAVKDLAYCLYDICSNKRKDAGEATAYNGLIAVWADLTRMAASVSLEYQNNQTAMSFQED